MDAAALRLITKFNRIHNQYATVRKNLMIRCSGLELYPAEMHVLVAVAANPGCSVTELSESLSITRSAVSQLLKKTTAKGLLIKERDAGNERTVRLTLTEQGQDAVRDFTGGEQSLFGEFLEVMKAWPEDDIRAVNRFLVMLEEMFDRKLK